MCSPTQRSTKSSSVNIQHIDQGLAFKKHGAYINVEAGETERILRALSGKKMGIENHSLDNSARRVKTSCHRPWRWSIGSYGLLVNIRLVVSKKYKEQLEL